MVLFLHHRYRSTGGEDRAVDDLMWLVREHLGEDAELIERDSADVGRSRAAAGLLAGGLAPGDVAAAVRRTGARVVHAHNVQPTFGWRALAAAREAGARVVLHLHNYRLVCAVATCFTRGEDCTRCRGRDTAPGVRLRCRGDAAEAVVYGAALALWQRRLVASADRVAVPSAFARARLRDLRAPLPAATHVVPNVVREFADRSAAAEGGGAIVASRLGPEKGVEVAIAACRRAGVPLTVAGDGPERARLERLAAGAEVTFTGALPPAELAALRRRAGLAIVPTRAAETFGLAAAEAMAAGLPVVASRVGALADLVDADGLVAPGDADALAAAIARRHRDARAGDAGIERARAVASPEVVAGALRALYDG